MGGGGGTNTVQQSIPAELVPYYQDILKASQRASEVSAANSRGQQFSSYTPYQGSRASYYPGSATVGQTELVKYFPSLAGMIAGQGGVPEAVMSAGGEYGFQTTEGPYGYPRSLGYTAPTGQAGEGGKATSGGTFGRTVERPINPADKYVASPFQGPFVAQGNPLEALGLGEKAQLGLDLQNAGIYQDLLNLGIAQARGDYIDPESAIVQNQIQAALNPVRRDFEQFSLEARSGAAQQGAYAGSSRRDIQESLNLENLARVEGDISAGIVGEHVARERQLQQSAGQLIDEAARLAQLPPEILLQAGAGFRQLEQLAIEDALQRYEEGIVAPFRSLFPYASILQGTDIGRTTRSTPAAGGLGGGITGALGGAALGAGAADLLGYEGMGAGISTGLGGLLGGLAGYL